MHSYTIAWPIFSQTVKHAGSSKPQLWCRFGAQYIATCVNNCPEESIIGHCLNMWPDPKKAAHSMHATKPLSLHSKQNVALLVLQVHNYLIPQSNLTA